nr:diaminopimelate epimerase [Cellulosimicrobium cellulans]
MTRTRFTKGHGTRNDFVLLADTTGKLDLTPELVRALADRRGGIGGDGVIRLVPTALVPESREVLAEDPHAIWFMDYRNADGSVAEMCGNGVRVFAAFAERLGLVSFAGGTEVPVGTRAGVKRVRKEDDGWFAVDMGPWFLPGGRPALHDGYDATVVVRGWEVPRPALSVDLGNPHTVLAVAREDVLARADLTQAPVVEPHPAHGTNVELVVPLGETTADDGTLVGRVRMRVHERGVGETPSCGTGACAAALAVRVWGGPDAPDTWLVDVPGGTVRVRALEGDRVELAGPAELVYSGEVDLASFLPAPAAPAPERAADGETSRGPDEPAAVEVPVPADGRAPETAGTDRASA